MILPIVTGDKTKILRAVTTLVTEFDPGLQDLVSDMHETMLEPDGNDSPRGVGIAANQVGRSERVALVTFGPYKKNPKIVAMVNPEIIEFSAAMVKMDEGCLSLPGAYDQVKRPAKIKARWQNLSGEWCEKRLSGWDARIMQHEMDHLNGKLFIDRL